MNADNYRCTELNAFFREHPGMQAKIEALYRAHVAHCRKVGVPPEKFNRFALDIATSPAEARAGMLAPESPAEYVPAMRYEQYRQPKFPDDQE